MPFPEGIEKMIDKKNYIIIEVSESVMACSEVSINSEGPTVPHC